MLYQIYEFSHAAVAPLRQAAVASRDVLRNPANPFAETLGARATAAAFEMFINATRRYAKPEFELNSTFVDGVETPVDERIVARLPFCDLLWFRREGAEERNDPPVLIVAPMSGHFATLLRGTVQAMLPNHEVYITDWRDARNVPFGEGRFGLDEYIDYLIEFAQRLQEWHGERAHALGVCQPGVPLFCSASIMAQNDDPARFASITLMGSPIDTRVSPTEPNRLASTRPLGWFRDNVITTVPWPHSGFMRRVYPGFLQLSGFMAMNLDRHMDAHIKQFRNLVRGDGEPAAAHRKFYDEYLSVMDLAAEFYLETVDQVFQRHLLPRGLMTHRDRPVEPDAIKDVALLTIEGGRDDITGLGQTEAAHVMATSLPSARRKHYVHPEVGHYGVFNGSRWRRDIQPEVAAFIERSRDRG
ncbi:MAG: polyhydroxyalkanoate depolymerase [Neomegalonema sp.]|nr:polyhydroxyalkanoate depolymerase [Neomegalonema sp.]